MYTGSVQSFSTQFLEGNPIKEKWLVLSTPDGFDVIGPKRVKSPNGVSSCLSTQMDQPGTEFDPIQVKTITTMISLQNYGKHSLETNFGHIRKVFSGWLAIATLGMQLCNI